MRTEAQGWTIVHQKRTQWLGEFDGVFLGERDGNWLAGRMFRGQSMHDGFDENGEWWYANQYAWKAEHEASRALHAVREYVRLSKEAAQCWDGIFEQRAGEAVDRHWANRVPLVGVADMSSLWVRPGLTGDIRSGTYMLPAVEAKYDLLKLMRAAYSVHEAFRDSEQCKTGSALHKTYEAAIGAAGPVRLSVAGDRFDLRYEGRYNDSDERWGRTWTRNPHPGRTTA
ncbi:hypothetical protein FE633_17540 [Streptomyces montanus]|uniref:Uncharacterized protein n=1 Tax=Streptomyces montanus TaxID=2580423 RepID=A0A5R9FZY0_9ACTN|nr:hypothetical protein [Streptomyces montanus]TLS44945.1 hypothetical protein FE633_17540 [Streptomyces montanus]